MLLAGKVVLQKKGRCALPLLPMAAKDNVGRQGWSQGITAAVLPMTLSAKVVIASLSLHTLWCESSQTLNARIIAAREVPLRSLAEARGPEGFIRLVLMLSQVSGCLQTSARLCL